jgi:hypothetical protein
MSYRGRLTNQSFESVEAMRHAETREAMRRDVPTSEEIALENMPLDDLKAACNRLARSDAEKAALAATNADITVFLELHPEFQDSPKNADLIKLCLRNRDVKNPTLSDLEDAYERQKALGLLDIKDHIVNRNEKRKAEARADQIEAERALTEDELYAMPLNELARRARGW